MRTSGSRVALQRAITAALIALALLASCSTAPVSEPSDPDRTQAASAGPSARETDAAGSDDPLAACRGREPAGDAIEISVRAQSHAFDAERIEGPVQCQPSVIEFTNLDEAAGGSSEHEHNIFIRLDGVLGTLAFEGKTIGTGTIRYEVPGLPAGTHYFYCSLHAAVMKGDLIVAEAAS